MVRTFGADRHAPLGPVVCISPWNFPLAIFTGQVSAALAATRGNQIKAAEMLGLNRNTLRKKVRELDIKLMRLPR